MSKEELKIIINAMDSDIASYSGANTEYLSKELNITKYKVLKHLRNLKNKGLLIFKRGYEPAHCDYWGEWQHDGYFYSGWYITDKCKEELKELYEERNNNFDKQLGECC